MNLWMVLALAAVVLRGVAAHPPPAIERVAWLQGCWELSDADQIVEEQWMAPRAGSMLGISRTVRSGKLAAESQVVFENPAHDFPRQIGYRLRGDALLAWIAGSVNGKARRVEFPYRRVLCAGR